jgi:hypothetical protein
VCQKRQRRCAVALQLREEALMEWMRAETLHDVRACWGRLGGKITAHRFGPEHFAALSRRRRARPSHCAPSALRRSVCAATMTTPGGAGTTLQRPY